MLARRFEYELVKPLNEIATVAQDVRIHRRFDKRVEPLGIAELDRHGGVINALLDELEGWQGPMESERALRAQRASHDQRKNGTATCWARVCRYAYLHEGDWTFKNN